MALKTFRYCGYCAHSWIGQNGKVHCGHAVDEAAITAGDDTKNPIWAIRKYGSLGMITRIKQPASMLGPGTNSENMLFEDGAGCKVWKQKDPNAK